jgi:hypothetical protein
MAWWIQMGGHPWWRRWSDPDIVVDVWISADGVEDAYTDAWMSGDVLDQELDLWDSGQMTAHADPKAGTERIDGNGHDQASEQGRRSDRQRERLL